MRDLFARGHLRETINVDKGVVGVLDALLVFKPQEARRPLTRDLADGVNEQHLAASVRRLPRPAEDDARLHGRVVEEIRTKPEHAVKYGNEPGPTWTYTVVGALDTLFDVDFGSDGKVIAFGERSDDTRGSSGGDSN